MASLKSKNNKHITGILTVVVLVCAGFQYGFDTIPSWQKIIATGALSAAFSAILVMMTNLLPHAIKHKLVFARFINEMPGGRIHELCSKDPRITMSAIQEKWPDVFKSDISSQERNALWYNQIYKGVKDSPEVSGAHGSFLLYRDILAGIVSMAIGIILWNFFGNPQLFGEIVPAVYWVLGISAILSMSAARNAGNRFVVNAVTTALPDGSSDMP